MTRLGMEKGHAIEAKIRAVKGIDGAEEEAVVEIEAPEKAKTKAAKV